MILSAGFVFVFGYVYVSMSITSKYQQSDFATVLDLSPCADCRAMLLFYITSVLIPCISFGVLHAVYPHRRTTVPKDRYLLGLLARNSIILFVTCHMLVYSGCEIEWMKWLIISYGNKNEFGKCVCD